MKLRSLFLATLAAMAMISCSNENDPVADGGNNAEKNAVMQFRFSYQPSGAATRATEAGLAKEQTFSQALLFVAYTNGTDKAIAKTIARDEFAPVSSEANPSSDGKYYQSTPFEVVAGEVKAYVIMNPDAAALALIGTINNQVMAPAAVEAKLKELTSSVVPDAENSFIMYGETPTVANLMEKQTTTVTVTVTRIAAKLKEETATASWDVTKPATNDNALDKTVKVNFKGYAFTNLTSASNIVEQSDKKVTEFIETSVFTGEFKAFEYLPMNAVADDAQITYCFENYNADVNPANGTGITSILYKAQIVADGINDTEAVKDANVYVWNNTVYSFAGLKEAFGTGLKLTDDSSIAEFGGINIYKYEGGMCYYRQPIYTGAAGNNVIVRNNVYKLAINSVSKLGFPTIIPAADKTMMKLDLIIEEWTVNDNSFDL